MKAVLFDLDDTLHDDTLTYRRAAESVSAGVAAERGIDAKALTAAYVAEADAFWHTISPAAFQQSLAGLRTTMWSAALKRVGIHDEALAAFCGAEYNRYRREYLVLWPGALDGYFSRLRLLPLTVSASLVYDRSGSPRFYGIGNQSPAIDETDYTSQEGRAQTQIGYNLSHAWQLQYTLRERVVDVLPGSLAGIEALQTRFGNILGVGTTGQLLNRLSVVYDTRNDPTIPTDGVKWVAYGGLASRHGAFNDSMYSETGVDGRAFWPVADATIVATHLALRYLLSSEDVPFWALSSIGGGDSQIGGPQALRGYGEGRYYDRDYFSSSIEIRRRVLEFSAISTHVEVEVTPFVDLGRVFARSGTFPLEQLHQVYGIGFRGIARPSVVGYVDIGYGNSGVAAFTGISYPF